MNELANTNKIDCQHIINWIENIPTLDNDLINIQLKTQIKKFQDTYKENFEKYKTLVAKKDTDLIHKNFLLDLRTYLCYNDKCEQKERNHRRITNYNYKKIDHIIKDNLNLEKLAIELIQLSIIEKIKQPTNIKRINFVKESKIILRNIEPYRPIETVFSEIDEIVQYNSNSIKNKEAAEAPGMKIQQPNNYRMTYGDLNYLGNNKAIFYFNRGTRGIQEFINSVHSLKKQPQNKDIVIIDDIVFTSNCKCDSSTQHKKIFPHYRVTCAAGLTCPARLNNIEKIIYTRNQNASTETFTTARAMLIRFW